MNPFDFIEERRREKEIERDMQARRGKMQIQRHINNQKKMSTKLWEMGKRAMELGDKRQFTSIGKQYLWTLEDVKRWERYLLAFESIEARRDQARSMSEFMKSVNAMSKSMMANSNPEVGLARAQNLEQMLDYMMDMTDETIFNTEMLGEDEQNDAIKALEQEMKRETAVEGEKETAQDSVDSRIADGLKAIEQEMRKDVSK
jgi:hypothetical protein